MAGLVPNREIMAARFTANPDKAALKNKAALEELTENVPVSDFLNALMLCLLDSVTGITINIKLAELLPFNTAYSSV